MKEITNYLVPVVVEQTARAVSAHSTSTPAC
jgi:hypothetical protein